MCTYCDQEVRTEYDIRDTDLAGLPFTLVHWICGVEGCTAGRTILRDYGISPFYFWPVKKWHDEKKHRFRGGWVDLSNHWKLCRVHNDLADQLEKQGQDIAFRVNTGRGVEAQAKYLLSKIKPHGRKYKNRVG